MILFGLALIASGAVSQTFAGEIVRQASHAIEASRIDQARLMIARAIEAGAAQAQIDRLLADLAFADRDYARAAPLYDALIAAGATDVAVRENAGLARLYIGDVSGAAPLLRQATAASGASWRAWNALGVIADFQRDWSAAETAYRQAATMAPERAEVVNNMGWSLLLQGRWLDAESVLRHAAKLDPELSRAKHNLELARAALSQSLPERRSGESDDEWSARLNDAGVVARAQGNDRKAVAAFTRALLARSEWFARAANNLSMAEATK